MGTKFLHTGQLDQSQASQNYSTVQLCKLCLLLEGYDSDIVEYLCSGFEQGFAIEYSGDHTAFAEVC